MTDTAALAFYAAHKAALFPIPTGQKAPHGIVKSFKHDHSSDPAQWARWQAEHPGCNFGVVAFASQWIIVDIDTSGGEAGQDEGWALWSELCESWGFPGPLSPHVQSARGGWHVYFAVPPDIDTSTLRQPDAIKKRINVRCVGYTVAAGSYYDGTAKGEGSGPYLLNPDAPAPHPAPKALLDHCARAKRTATVTAPGSRDKGDVAALLEWLNDHDAFDSYEDWCSVGMALKLFGGEGKGLWALTHNDTVTPDVIETKWESFASAPTARSVTLASFLKRAKDLGWTGSVRPSAASMFAGVAEAAAASGAEITPVAMTSMMTARGSMEILPSGCDEALAQEFVAKHGNCLRYVAAWGKWFRYDGQCWRPDDTLMAYDMVRNVCREVAGAVDARAAKAIASAKTVAAVERMAKADRRIAARTDQWDCDPWLLNTPAGVVGLRTGKIRPASPEDYQTKMTAAAPGGDCPTWLAFLDRVTGGNRELVDFLQVALGYGLTGVTTEHAMFFLYGTGANGKSVLLSTIAGILRDYHTVAPIETFTASSSERHPTDLAGLRGARLVTATETEEGRRWAESKIKVLTGGDKISARFMRQDFFEFVPQFKLMIAGNHKPGLRAVDEAIRRRIHLIPFTVTIPPAERDHTLTDRLKAEWGGILAWLIEGCRKWQEKGLAAPDIVKAATTAYLDSEDALAAWIDERCERDPDAFTAREQLFGSWSAWASAAGEFVGSSRRFQSALEGRGFEEGRKNNKRGVRGLQIKQPSFAPPPAPPY